MLYVVNGKSNAGANPANCRDAASLQSGGTEAACAASNSYVWQLTKAGFLSLPVRHGEALEDLTGQVARNNYYNGRANGGAKGMLALRHHYTHPLFSIPTTYHPYDQI